MRILTWNMSHCLNKPRKRAAAWDALCKLKPDVALLQEVVPPPQTRSVVYREIGGTRKWGSAVLGLTIPVEEVTHAKGRYSPAPMALHASAPGVAVARAVVDGRELTFVSMYGVIQEGYADTTVHRQLSDLVPLLDDATRSKGIVLGGDLNITTQWIGTQARYRDWELATFARIRAFGLVDVMDLKRGNVPLAGCDCSDGEKCRHIQTQRHSNSPRPWQNDYLFASKALTTGDQIVSAEVVNDADLLNLSGHMPLVFELNLS